MTSQRVSHVNSLQLKTSDPQLIVTFFYKVPDFSCNSDGTNSNVPWPIPHPRSPMQNFAWTREQRFLLAL